MRPEQAALSLAKIGVILLLIVLFLRGFSLAETIESPAGAVSAEPEPVTNRFSISEDGTQIYFREVLDPPAATDRFTSQPEWFRMSVEGGPIIPANEPETDIRPFVLRDEQIFILVGDGFTLMTGSLPGTRVREIALSPDRKEIAFFAGQESGPGGLYVLNANGELSWLGEESYITGISWSQDGEKIAYLAMRDGTEQVFVIDRLGQQLVQMTDIPGEKSRPAWLNDSQTILFARQVSKTNDTAPKLPTTSIYRVNLSQTEPEMVASSLFAISEILTIRDNSLVAFSQPGRENKRREQLFFLEPYTRELRRVYPPVSIDSLSCPPTIRANGQETLQYIVTNTGLLPASVPVVLRLSGEPLPILSGPQNSAFRIESIDLGPGESLEVEWPIKAASGLYTYISLMINEGEVYPLSEMHCKINNKYLGLPNLSFLPLSIFWSAIGAILSVPWLRHRKSKSLWMLLAVYFVLICLLLLVESILSGSAA